MPNPPNPESSSAWITILTQLLAGAVVIWKFVQKIYAEINEARSIRTLKNMADIYELLQDLLTDTKAKRALILYVSNGGGIPIPERSVYVSILYEEKDPELSSIRRMWQDVPLDSGYVDYINHVISDNKCIGEPKDLKAGFLKSLYEEEGVKYFASYAVLRTKERFYFLSIRWTDINDVPPAGEVENHLLTTANRLALLLRGRVRAKKDK